MRKTYLLYTLIFALLAVGCKKKYVTPPSITQPTKTETGGTTTQPVGIADLSNFKINGAECAYDENTHAYYYPVPSGNLTNYTVSFDTTTTKSVMIDGFKVTNNGTVTTALQANQEVNIKALNKLNEGPSFKLVVTGLPIVIVNAGGATIADDDVDASFSLINPDYIAEKSKIEISSKIKISIRGGTSRAYPKKSYKVHVVDDAGQDTDVSLLGLRNDNNWILDAMYIDQGRMRNRVCTDLWNSFNNVPYFKTEAKALNGTRGYMAEVFLNGRYNGVYCLTEKLDRKQLAVKKQYGDMYKADFWTNESDFLGASPYDDHSQTWGGWAFEYPDLGDSPAPTWKYLSDLVSFISTSNDSDFSAGISTKVDINNIVDYFIFMNLTRAADNQNKNTFLSFYDYRTAGAFFYSPWDLDGTMGRSAGGTYSPNEIIGAGNNNLFQRLLKLNAANFKSLTKARWNSIKANQLSKSKVNTTIEGYRKLLVSTNAMAREKIVWSNLTQDLNTEAAYMNVWYSAQFDLMDNYINNL